MSPLPRRIRVAARLWQFVGIAGGLVAGLQISKVTPDDPFGLVLIPFLTIAVCLGFVVSGHLAIRRRWRDLLIPSSVAVAIGFLTLLSAAAMLASRSLPVPSNEGVNVFLRRPPADAYVLSITGTMLLLGGLLALSRRRVYRAAPVSP